MKKVMGLIVGLLLVFSLTACDEVYIEEDVIAVMYDNVEFNGEEVYVDVWITNGTDSNYDVTYVEFWFELPDGSQTEAVGAGFDINETITKAGFKKYELTFQKEYVYYDKSDLDNLGYDLGDLEFFYWFEE